MKKKGKKSHSKNIPFPRELDYLKDEWKYRYRPWRNKTVYLLQSYVVWVLFFLLLFGLYHVMNHKPAKTISSQGETEVENSVKSGNSEKSVKSGYSSSIFQEFQQNL